MRAASERRRLGAVMCAVVLTAAFGAGCGGSSSTPPSDTAGAATTTAPSPSTSPDQSDPNTPPVAELVDGVYTADDGSFTIRPDPSWDSAVDVDAVYFAVNADRTGTLSVISESRQGAPDDLDDFVDFSLDGAEEEFDDVSVISRTKLTLPSGDTVSRVEFSGSLPAEGPYKLLMITGFGDTNAVTTTFAAPADQFDGLVGDAEAAMRTLDIL